MPTTKLSPWNSSRGASIDLFHALMQAPVSDVAILGYEQRHCGAPPFADVRGLLRGNGPRARCKSQHHEQRGRLDDGTHLARTTRPEEKDVAYGGAQLAPGLYALKLNTTPIANKTTKVPYKITELWAAA